MPLTTKIHNRLNELLVACVDVWLNAEAWSPMFGHWRGQGNLLGFAERYPTLKSQQTAGVYPKCIVIAEYCRFALSSDGTDEAIELLIAHADQILSGPDPFERGRIGCLVHAITHTVMAAVAFRSRDNTGVCKHIQLAAENYDRSSALTSVRTAMAPMRVVPPEKAVVDLSSNDQAFHVLQIAEQCGYFGAGGVTVSTWLMLHRLLAHVLGIDEPEPLFHNDLKVLLVGGPRGVVQPIRMEKHDAVVSGVFLDPLSFGVTVIHRSMRDSLKIAWRCCRQSTLSERVAVKISADLPELVGNLSGGSAGGLFAAGTIATARGQRLDSTRTTTCCLEITDRLLAEDKTSSLRPEDLQLGAVLGAVQKIDEAWQVEHGIEEVLLCPSDAASWHQANPNCTRPVITPASSLHELVEKLSGNRRYDREIERHARMQHGEWERVKAAIRDDDATELERDHRFDCYVDPTFRVEGPLRNIQKVDAEEPIEQDRIRATGMEREEFAVPGEAKDEQLLNLLELSMRGTPWPDAPSWLKPGRSLVLYDVAGAGKTVCSHRLINVLTNESHFKRLFSRPTAPLVIRLDGSWRREFVTRGRLLTISEMLVEELVEHMKANGSPDYALARNVVEHAIREKRVVLILDGFDQFLEEDRQHVIEVFHQHADARGCHWIITSRIHTIDELRLGKSFFANSGWLRARLDPFSVEQQDAYFHTVDGNGRQIGDRWQQMVDREAMSDLLGLPMVLAMIRILIDDADRHKEQLPVFYSLSQLYLVTSRKLLARALEKNRREVDRRLQDKSRPIPRLSVPEQLELLEHVLTLMAFQLMLMEEYNGKVDGKDRVTRFERLCRDRFLFELKQQFQKADEFDKDDIRKERERQVVKWDWALEVLRTIEFSHRSVTEAYNDQGLAFRSRKMLECHAARYLTKYATAWDVFATNDPSDMPVVNPEDEEQDLTQLCAWNYTTGPQWRETWELAINMPHNPISATDHDGVIEHAVIDHLVTCRSLSALFRQPKAWPARDIRPTELIYRCWHLFEYDERLLRERRFSSGGRLISGNELAERFGVQEVEQRGRKLLLGQRIGDRKVCRLREEILCEFRKSSEELRAELECRRNKVLQSNGTWIEIPLKELERRNVLGQWQSQGSKEKSLTLLQCPPQSWLDAIEDATSWRHMALCEPCGNNAIRLHEKELLTPLFIQATQVTRAMYHSFDSAFECSVVKPEWGEPYWSEPNWAEPFSGEPTIAMSIEVRASAFGPHLIDNDFPIICTNWFDAWIFCKWIGQKYRLPTEFEWEHAARAGTKTAYHFGDGLNGFLANCDGNSPNGLDPGGSTMPRGKFLSRTTPVGLAEYPCNDYGLFDVHGNVWEWCQNCYDTENAPPAASRVLRGGSWFNSSELCRSASRIHDSPEIRNNSIGFRVSVD